MSRDTVSVFITIEASKGTLNALLLQTVRPGLESMCWLSPWHMNITK